MHDSGGDGINAPAEGLNEEGLVSLPAQLSERTAYVLAIIEAQPATAPEIATAIGGEPAAALAHIVELRGRNLITDTGHRASGPSGRAAGPIIWRRSSAIERAVLAAHLETMN